MAGALTSQGMCQHNIAALFRTPALLGTRLLYLLAKAYRVRVSPKDVAGTIESSGTIQQELAGAFYCISKLVALVI